jgi:hypothetical protein
MKGKLPYLLIVVPDVPEAGAPRPHELLEVGRHNAGTHQAHPPYHPPTSDILLAISWPQPFKFVEDLNGHFNFQAHPPYIPTSPILAISWPQPFKFVEDLNGHFNFQAHPPYIPNIRHSSNLLAATI